MRIIRMSKDLKRGKASWLNISNTICTRRRFCGRPCANSSGQSSSSQAEDAQTLARECAWNEPGAADKVNEVLASISLEDDIVDRRYARHEILSNALDDKHWDSRADVPMKAKVMGDLLRPNPRDLSMETPVRFMTSTP
jgi:hypothetical protein